MFGIDLNFLKRVFARLTFGDLETLPANTQENPEQLKDFLPREPIEYPPHIVERFKGRSMM